MLHDDIGALVEQCLGGVGFLAGIEPGIHPDDLDLDVRIDALRADHGGVDAGDNFRNRERADIAEHAGLRHLGRDLALDVAALVPARRIGRHVLVALVAGSVLEMHVRVFLRDLQRRIHVAEGRREDQLVAGAHQLLDGALGVGTLRDVLEIGGLDLVAEFFYERLTRVVVLVGPAEVADRAKVDEPDLQLVGGRGAARDAPGKQQRSGGREKCFPHRQSPNSRGEPNSGNAAPHRGRPEGETQRSGTNTVPSAAGAVEPPVRVRDSSTSTMTVARYGSDDMNCDGIPMPAPCACSCRMVTAPNR